MRLGLARAGGDGAGGVRGQSRTNVRVGGGLTAQHVPTPVTSATYVGEGREVVEVEGDHEGRESVVGEGKGGNMTSSQRDAWLLSSTVLCNDSMCHYGNESSY